MKKLVLCLLFLILLLGSFVNAETCLSESKCNRCPGNQDTPKSYTLKVEDVKNCADDSLSELNGEYNLVQYTQDWGDCMWEYSGSSYASYITLADYFGTSNYEIAATFYTPFGDTTYFSFYPSSSCAETMHADIWEVASCDDEHNPDNIYGGTATLTPCKENSPPTVTNNPKVIYVKEKANTLSLSKVDEKSGKMKINSLVYDTVISDNETKVEDLKLQIGSSKIFPAEPAAQVKFNPEDIGLVFKNLPLIGRFILNVTDDGTIDGQTEKGETKSTVNDTKVLWCPENITLYSAYDVGLVANGKQRVWSVGFDDGETIIQQALKEISSTLIFTNDKKTPIKGEFHIHIINERVGGLKLTIETVDASRSKAIKELQAKMEKVLGKSMSEQIARWGCKPDATYGDKWGKLDFPDPNDADKTVSIEVCKEYTDKKIEYDMIYSFEKGTFTITGGSGGNVKTMKMSVPLKNFKLILDELAEDDPSVTKQEQNKPPPKLKVGWRGGKDWSYGGLKPSDMIKKMQNLLIVCDINKNQNKVIEAEKDKIKKTITTTGKKSYYYLQEDVSKEDTALKISIDVPLLEPITKIFNYSQINFTDEEALSLFRYEDDEIENLCYMNLLSETNFSVSPQGGNFSVQDLEIVIPENAVETNGILIIKKVNVTNCIKDIDNNHDEKINLNEMLSYLKSSMEIDETFPSQRVLELLLRWRVS